MTNNQALSYQQIQLVPRYSELRTRADADVSVEFLGRRFKLPVIPANMQTVINEDLAHYLSENDLPYIMHRFGDTYAFVERANRENWKLISISVGVKQQDKELLRRIAAASLRVDWITIDVSHGHHVLVKEMIEYIKSGMYSPIYGGPKIIAGNVATPEAVRDLTSWGADCCKIGVGGGAACSTKHQTAFHVPMWTCVKECVEEGGPVVNVSARLNEFIPGHSEATIPIVADGGVRHNGDIAKALVAGANLVMAGSLFAACVDAPGENVYESVYEGPKRGDPSFSPSTHYGESFYAKRLVKKRYHGSASFAQKGERRHVEGFQVELPCNGLTYAEKLQEIKEGLSSAISYAGGKDLSAFKHVRWVEVSE